MTRETKIGLLVGLAFIIVVGILLSDHMTTATERPSAALAEAGRGVQAGVSAPGAVAMTPPPIEMPAPAHSPAMPQGVAQAPAAPQVMIVPPSQQSPIVIQQQQPSPAAVAMGPVGPQNGLSGDPALPPIVTHTPISNDPFENQELARTARAAGEPLVPVIRTSTPVAPAGALPAMAANNAREYKAQPGDTLSRIAALLPGGATKANREAVVKLNPTLQKDPNKVISGRTYLLPTDLAQATLAKAGGLAGNEAPLVQKVTPVEKSVKIETAKADSKSDSKDNGKAAAARVYVVQKGDTLGRIAAAQLGSSKLAYTIVELNKDVLSDSNLIKVDMKLKLPAKEG